MRGVELGVQGSITERWRVYGGLVVMESEVLKSDIAGNVGRRMANVPDLQFSLLTKYRLTEKLTVGGHRKHGPPGSFPLGGPYYWRRRDVLLCIPEVLTKEQVAHCRQTMNRAEWIDGRATAGAQSGSVKRNMQLPEGSPAAQELGDMVLGALARSPLFISAAIPQRIFPPLFNSYGVGHSFGTHVDGAIRAIPGTPIRIRTDLSVTLFLAGPEEYDGGELTVEDKYGAHEVKLPAGDMVLYPATSLHHVKPVTRGTRVASFFWLQSMVRDDGARALLFDLDQTIQELTAERGLEDPACVRLTGIYHNLIRYWADA